MASLHMKKVDTEGVLCVTVYTRVSMEKNSWTVFLGMMGVGSGRVGHDASKEKYKRKLQLYKTVAKMRKMQKCIETHDNM